MDTKTGTLTDFLLARISEDEDAARNLTGELTPFDAWTPARVLVECDMKRKIVATAFLGPDGDYEWGWDAHGEDVLRLLAMPCADHPDYRDEWRQ